MSDLVTLEAGVATTTSLIVAIGTETGHHAVIQLVRNNLDDFEEFGRVAFEMQPFDTAGGVQTREVATLNEEHATLLLTYMRNKPVVKDFKKRLVREFWQMRRGSTPAIPQTYAEALRAAADQCERAELAEKARAEAEAHAKALEAPASAWKHLADSQGDYEVADAAKVLSRDPNINIGRDRLFSFMAAEGWVYRNRSTSRWKAYQTQIDCGRLSEKFGKPFLHEPSGQMRLSDPTIRVTPKGIEELHKRLGGSGQLPLVAAS